MVGLGDLPGDPFGSRANDTSADGSVIVGVGNSPAGPEAFRWTQDSGMSGIGDLPGGRFESLATGVSADGTIMVGVGHNASGQQEAFRWNEDSGTVGLGVLPGRGGSQANAVSADGSTVVGYGFSPLVTEAFRWSEIGGMAALGDLEGGGFFSIASGSSSDGSVIVGTGTTDTGQEAFIWELDSGMQNLHDVLTNDFNLDITGWSLNNAAAVSADGRTIAGQGKNPTGSTEAWIAHLGNPIAQPDFPTTPPLLPPLKETDFIYPITSDHEVFLVTQAGGLSSDCDPLPCFDPKHAPDAGYYSLDIDVGNVDNPSAPRATIVAAKGGTIVDTGTVSVAPDGKTTKQVIIKHGDSGYYSVYGEFEIADGLALGPISEGNPLGVLIGAKGEHLHFQVKYDPEGNGLTKFKSTKNTPNLNEVTVGRRPMEKFLLTIGADGNPDDTPIRKKDLAELPRAILEGPEYAFDFVAGEFGVGVDSPIYIDPHLAIGYDYQVFGDAAFASVLLPNIGDDLFDLFLFDPLQDAFVFEELLTAGTAYAFEVGGVERFRILGIEASAGLSPDDPEAFVTGLTFTTSGSLTLTQTPIVQAQVPEPSSIALLFGGVLCIVFYRRRVVAELKT